MANFATFLKAGEISPQISLFGNSKSLEPGSQDRRFLLSGYHFYHLKFWLNNLLNNDVIRMFLSQYSILGFLNMFFQLCLLENCMQVKVKKMHVVFLTFLLTFLFINIFLYSLLYFGTIFDTHSGIKYNGVRGSLNSFQPFVAVTKHFLTPTRLAQVSNWYDAFIIFDE